MLEGDEELLEGEEVMDGKNGDFGNMDFSSIAGMFKNMDMSQIMNLLGSFDMSRLSSLFGSGGVNSQGNMASSIGKEYEVLNALKPMVNSKQSDIIDVILQIYTISKILR